MNNKVVTNSNTKYHNVFGIAAYDNDPLREGIKYAKQAGWDTVSKAIVGGAKFIGNSYVKAGQNTLYKMRWNPAHPGTHQYATDVDWANINAKIIKGYYDKIGEVGKYFDIPHNINKQHEYRIKSHPPLSIIGMTFDPFLYTSKIAVIVYHQF